ncbi:MAG TPA: TetR/AcrR family transcriptional regulator [Clostridia bacterium]|nr:TetR/AcrR family transcriptional regulator [Clostridia bacterium]
MDKRTRILNALEELLREGKAGTASVMDIAKKAGIAKGGMYYYFKDKEAVLDALARRQYANVIMACKQALAQAEGDAITKLKLLLYIYRNTAVDSAVDKFLHQTQNAAIHQKSMADIVQGLSPLIAEIFEQGDREKSFVCKNPTEYAQVLLCVPVFLLDPGIFSWTGEQVTSRLKALADILEKGLCAKNGALSFLYENWTKQKLSDSPISIEHEMGEERQ